MKTRAWKVFWRLGLCGILSMAAPSDLRQAEAAERYIEGIGIETSSSYKIKVNAPGTAVYMDRTVHSPKVAEAVLGKTYKASSYEMEWVLIEDENIKGYLKVDDRVTLLETACEEMNPRAFLRSNVVEYALEFVGKPYVWGGEDPHTGVDCSGFTAYVMKHVAGVPLTHASWIQAAEGRAVQSPRPGDLVFYSNGSRINHVAIYIGNGQIVHASSRKTGIRVSAWNRRTPVKIVDVLS